MEKNIGFDTDKITGKRKLVIIYDFTEEHSNTLLIVFNNEGSVDFKNRWDDLKEDLDGNKISWKICDELVEMGLLEEDELSIDVSFELTRDGYEIITEYLNE